MRSNIPYLFIFLLLPVLLNAQEETLIETLISKGKEAYYDGDYQASRSILLDALSRKGTTAPDAEWMEIQYRLGKVDGKLRVHGRALEYLESGLTFAEAEYGKKSEEASDFLYEIGAVYSQMYAPQKASTYFLRCLENYKELHGAESVEVGYMYMNFGIDALKMGDYAESEEQFKKCFAIFQASAEPQSEEFNRIYSNMGYLYRKMGNFERAIEYGTKALEIKLLHYAPDHPGVAKYHRNLARAWQDKGDPGKALPFALKTVEILENSLGKDHSTTVGSYGELAGIYADMGEYQEARKLYRKANRKLEKLLPPTHPYLVGGYFNVGTVYEDEGKWQEALSQYQKALELFKSADSPPPQLLAEALRKMAGLYQKMAAPEDALKLIQEGMGYLIDGDWLPEEIYKTPAASAVLSKINFLELILLKAELLEGRFHRGEKLQDLQTAFESAKLAVELLQEISGRYYSEADRQLLMSRHSEAYKMSVRLAWEMYEQTGNRDYLYEAFSYSDANKSGSLWYQMERNRMLKSAGVPQSKLDEISELEAAISSLEESETETPTEVYHQKMAGQQIRYKELLESIHAQSGVYERFWTQPVSPDELHKKLKVNGQTLVEYFHDESFLYIFVINSEGIQGVRKAHAGKLKPLVSQIRETNGLLEMESANSWAEVLSSLHELLIAPIQPLLTNNDRLLIVPHGWLHYVPFECLAPADESSDFRNLDYLLRHWSVGYAWSASFWLGAKSTGRGVQSFYSFAPGFGGEIAAVYRYRLTMLPHAAEEAKAAAGIFGGQVISGAQATESRFRELSTEADVLHLATHAIAREEAPFQSGIWFSESDTEEDGFLSALEIYNLKLNTQLSVISACYTGAGKLQEGEGIMSLGRAFTYAGSESVVMSHWVANDRSTAEILEYFYEALKAGMPKDRALQKARLQYLDNADALMAHPFFWGHLSVNGQMTPLKSSSDWMVWGALGLSLFLVFMAAFRRAGKRRERKSGT
ncbi:MAG: CHAT domain-containing protein [Bacteroidetes bacterium]|nr:CHAT domain-containing protein [Bacteroidota bacterium]